MGADLESELARVSAHELVNAVRRDRLIEPPGPVVAERPEECASVSAVARSLNVLMNERTGAGMQRQIARLAAFARHFDVRHALADVAKVFDLELAQFFAPQRVKEQGGKNGAVALAADVIVLRRLEELAGLMIGNRRRLAFAALRLSTGL